jgi:xanthosine utilization system XapX-like protein
LYWLTPTLSVAALQLRLAVPAPPVVVKLAGALGGVVSGTELPVRVKTVLAGTVTVAVPPLTATLAPGAMLEVELVW